MDITNAFKNSRFYSPLSCDWWYNYNIYPNDWLFPNNTHPNALLTSCVKNFLPRAFFLLLIYPGNFSLC